MDINLVAPVNSLGYGTVGLNLVKSLSKKSKVALWIIGNGEAPPEDHELLKQCVGLNAQFFNKQAPCLRLWHQFDMAMMIGSGRHAGFPIFELDSFNELEKHHLKSLDWVFVCSEWAKDILKNHNIENVSVAPLGVDTNIFYPRPDVSLNKDTTNFLNIGKWEVRKGHDVLVEAFNKAFEPTDNVHLILNCYNPFLLKQDEQGRVQDGNNTWTKLYKESKLGDKITVIPNRLQSQLDVANLMNAVDCGIFPSRAEGWNLEALEMMACGKHVIVTNYAAHTEFCNDKNSYLIKVDNVEPAYDGIWFKGQGNWAELGDKQIEMMVHEMRLTHQIKNGGGDLYNEAGVKTAERFTWDGTVDNILKAFYGDDNERVRTKGLEPS